ncbi:MAG: DUF167 domain-containing protein [Desulfurivibrionaceae bacterium]
MPFLQEQDSALILYLYIQTRASVSKFSGIHGQELKLSLTAPPVNGKANKALLTFLASFFRVSKTSVSLIKGKQSRHKICRIEDLSMEEAERILNQKAPGVIQ